MAAGLLTAMGGALISLKSTETARNGQMNETPLGSEDSPATPQTRILLVDDDARSLLALWELLQDENLKPVLANSGEEAFRWVLRDEFAVILMDVRMPGMGGFECARMIREHPPSRHTPIIFLTGVEADSRSVFRGYEAGAVDYIIKPVLPEVLKSKVAVFVELHNKNAALAREINERKLAESQLRKSEENLRLLAGHLQTAREEERTQIAREIHDELGQALTGLKMDLSCLADQFECHQKPLVDKVKSMAQLIDQTVNAVRRIAAGLRPGILDELGLAAAIEWQAKAFRMHTGIRCQVSLPATSLDVDKERATAAFRIFQEMLTNVARHAGATRVDVDVRRNGDTLVLEVRDNGRGIGNGKAAPPKTLGLLGMRERALMFGGEIEIVGDRGKGTRAAVSIPLRMH